MLAGHLYVQLVAVILRRQLLRDDCRRLQPQHHMAPVSADCRRTHTGTHTLPGHCRKQQNQAFHDHSLLAALSQQPHIHRRQCRRRAVSGTSRHSGSGNRIPTGRHNNKELYRLLSRRLQDRLASAQQINKPPCTRRPWIHPLYRTFRIQRVCHRKVWHLFARDIWMDQRVYADNDTEHLQSRPFRRH